jgi:hypothetical protein
MVMHEREWQAAKQESLATLAFLSEVRWRCHAVLESCRMQSDSTYTLLGHEGRLSSLQLSLSRGLNASISTFREAAIAGLA